MSGKEFFTIKRVVNTVSLNSEETEAVISQVIELDCSRAGTLFISQHLDDIEMFESARFLVDRGFNCIPLKQLRVIRPRFADADGVPVFYKLAVQVFAAGGDLVEHAEMHSMRPFPLQN